jgi:type VI secretion system protein ImpF
VARREPANLTIRPSVLDRLLDDEPDVTREPPVPPHEAVRRAVQAVRRDLEWLLNTRLTWVDDRLASAEHAARSLATYGLADYSTENLNDADARGRLKQAIEKAIARFEPRLARVVVSAEPLRQHDRTLRFRIEAVLHVDPIREPVTFDTVLDTGGAAQVLEV